jgi:prepilin-type N-terminal cleavage/methylation domain-containing protein
MRRRGFTLLEIMISIVILAIAMTVAWQTFASATRAWTSAREMLDSTHHGDFILTQLSSALRSMAFFESTGSMYGFRMEDTSGDFGEHTISWVTSSQAFIPRGSEFQHGLHRIEVGAGKDDDGNEGLLVSVWQHLADEEKVEKKSWVVSENIKGLTCYVYNIEDEDWDDEWEDTNSIPGLIEITLFAEAPDEDDDPIEYRQLIEIPLGPPVTNEVDSAR